MKLKIAAKVGEDDRAYFHETIEPLIDGDEIEYVGEIGEAEKDGFPRQCRGTAVSDRLAGTVRAGRHRGHGVRHAGHRLGQGAMPEIVDEGVTGFVVRLDRARQWPRCKRVPELDRDLVRQAFERRFSAERMVRDYEAIYARSARRAAPPASRPLDGDKLIAVDRDRAR